MPMPAVYKDPLRYKGGLAWTIYRKGTCLTSSGKKSRHVYNPYKLLKAILNLI